MNKLQQFLSQALLETRASSHSILEYTILEKLFGFAHCIE